MRTSEPDWSVSHCLHPQQWLVCVGVLCRNAGCHQASSVCWPLGILAPCNQASVVMLQLAVGWGVLQAWQALSLQFAGSWCFAPRMPSCDWEAAVHV